MCVYMCVCVSVCVFVYVCVCECVCQCVCACVSVRERESARDLETVGEQQRTRGNDRQDLSIYPSVIVLLPIHLSIYFVYLSLYLCICVYSPVYLSIYLSFHGFYVHLSIHLSIYLSIYLPIKTSRQSASSSGHAATITRLGSAPSSAEILSIWISIYRCLFYIYIYIHLTNLSIYSIWVFIYSIYLIIYLSIYSSIAFGFRDLEAVGEQQRTRGHDDQARERPVLCSIPPAAQGFYYTY